ncbi:hypothetical protein [Treponema lecithinolyticum]|jgi:hypothetical protein|uniref:Asp23/Gls24 family envelope stress response protein n=1 Tax=Treponema lecithinolyticum ATCC 700332 TaxID=1321815 RepID=A0ABN0NZR9_TRELE|nr:hypothetical protein [Treponema lecithinolyticum]ERJ93630.1 hypothetical protein HMPREF9193_00719 [Treponema lecithinolyticum ATCC 700332]
MKLFDEVLALFKGITVFALVGASGTGKSFRAKLLAQKYDINAIIDDGLLIQDDKILAGHSAKREKTFLAAVRAAVFDDKEHRDQIARALKKQSIKRLLILGTSEKMVQKIAMRLQLPPPSKIIKIEDIATQDEIDFAIRSRHIEGKHVIPVPALEIKRSYPQIFYDAIRVKLARKEKISGNNTKVYEKSVVRPEFSKKGRVTISEAALTQMVMHCVSEFDSEIKIKKLTIKTDAHGYKLIITTDVPFGTQLAGKIHNLQKYVIENLERYTGILIESVNIIVDKISRT